MDILVFNLLIVLIFDYIIDKVEIISADATPDLGLIENA
jgi:hypothetical protein